MQRVFLLGGRGARSGINLDDLRFTAQLYANVFDDANGDTFALIWSRPNGRSSNWDHKRPAGTTARGFRQPKLRRRPSRPVVGEP